MKIAALSLAGTLALAAAVALPPAAEAALVNDYYSTDDVWNPPVAPGHVLLDVRTAYTLMASPSVLQLPVASLVCGIAPDWEVGVWGAYSFDNLGRANGMGQPQLLNPYVKTQLPWKLGSTIFGLVAGAQIPTAANQDHNVAIEGVASIQASDSLLVDLGLGTGVNLAADGGPLGHANAAAYETIPSGQTVFGELYTIVSPPAPTLYGEHLGVGFPITRALATDIDLIATETSAAGLVGLTPEVGVTYTF